MDSKSGKMRACVLNPTGSAGWDVVAVVLLAVMGCSSVSVYLEQEKGVSASEDARSYQGCGPNPPASR
jgi:hypothetical protein